MALGDQLTWWQVPPVLRKQVRNYVLAAIACSLAAVVLVWLRNPLGIPREPWGRYGPLVFGLLPLAIVWPLFLLGRRRIHRDFIEARGRLCTHCAYNLTSTADQGTCPECGKPFDAAKDAETWRLSGFNL